jgi:hypothetical protein
MEKESRCIIYRECGMSGKWICIACRLRSIAGKMVQAKVDDELGREEFITKAADAGELAREILAEIPMEDTEIGCGIDATVRAVQELIRTGSAMVDSSRRAYVWSMAERLAIETAQLIEKLQP